MTVFGKYFLGVVALAGFVTAACGRTPTGPTAVTGSPAAGASLGASSNSGGTRLTPASGGTAAGGADLQVSGSASTGSPNAGALFSYTFQVKNSGPDAATSATLTDALPAGTAYMSATVNGASSSCSLVDTTVACGLGDLASGGQAVVVINLAAPVTTGSFTNTGTAASSVADPNAANNSVTVTVQVKAPSVDTIKVTKCYTNATATSGGEMLIKAASSDTTARLFAYRPDGTLIGELQNGGGSRYGGTVMPWQFYDPVNVTIRSSSGGSITVPTTPFQL